MKQREMPRWMALPFLAVGLFIVLLSLGVIEAQPRTSHRAIFDTPHHWQVTSIGIAFACAGLSLFAGQRRRWLSIVIGLVLLPAFFAPLIWLFYLSGMIELPIRILASIPLGLGAAGAVAGFIQTIRGGAK